ncbi:hypothetical protein ACQBAT_15755 [Ornithinimicrobium sp. Y1847]|uniref:hypothetical protein n=1 Tax=unclassified Ornithinimicrobium TaxID=2615080 RepID=UPI003B67C40E
MASPTSQEAPEGAAAPSRRRSGAHAAARQRPWSYRVVAIPWLTLTLLLCVAVLAVDLLRPRTYEATAVITATDDRTASWAAVELTRLSLPREVAREIELDTTQHSRPRLQVERRSSPQVEIIALADDPRLAALAADTAAMLSVEQRPDVLTLSTAAETPVDSRTFRSQWWTLVALALLLAGVVLERLHDRWELRLHGSRRGGDGTTRGGRP